MLTAGHDGANEAIEICGLIPHCGDRDGGLGAVGTGQPACLAPRAPRALAELAPQGIEHWRLGRGILPREASLRGPTRPCLGSLRGGSHWPPNFCPLAVEVLIKAERVVSGHPAGPRESG